MGAAGAMSNLETETRKKKKQDSQKRRITRQPSMGSVSSALKANGGSIFDDDMKSHSDPRENGNSSGHHHNESFLNYFFGGASKAERPALVSDLPNGTSVQSFAPTMSVSSMMENEIEKKMEQVSLQQQQNGMINNDEAPYPVSDREEIESQLIRRFIFLIF